MQTTIVEKPKLTAKEKRMMLTEFIELHVMKGYDISGYMGKSLSYFDYDKLQERINWFKRLDQ